MIINNRYFIDDPEYGFYETDKDSYEKYIQFQKRIKEIRLKENINYPKPIGTVILYGTVEEIGNNEWKKFNELFDELFDEPLKCSAPFVKTYYIPKDSKNRETQQV